MDTSVETNSDLTQVIADAIINHTMADGDYKCRYCEKTFRKESTLAAHLCEPKRRAQQENETGVKLGFQAYLRFYEITQGSAKLKTYQHFSDSAYYNAFVKFGRHMVNIRAINTTAFVEYVIKQNKKLDHWCKDTIYQEFLFHHLRREHSKDALERSMQTMVEWAQDKDSVYNHYFLYAGNNRIVHDIVSGRVSSWVLFNCNTGIAALENLSDEQMEMVYNYIDPDYWKRRFQDFFADTEWVKNILQEAKL